MTSETQSSIHHAQPPGSQRGDLVQVFGSLGILLAGAITIYLVNPVTTRLIPPCPFLWATNCYCPGCGAARAFHSLARGDFGSAFSYNPLLVLALPAFAYIYLSFLSGELFGRKLPTPQRLSPYTPVVPVIILVYWVARNLPWEPFTYLAP